MKTKRWVAAVCASVALSGCATSQDYLFSKLGATEADFHNDKTACEDEAVTAKNVLGRSYVEARNRCLQKKGWTLTNPKP